MPARFVNLDRQTPMFLPCDLRDWLPAGHVVHFILEAVEQIPTAHFHVNHHGTGSEQYPPTMMLAVAVKNMMSALGPRPITALRSILMVSRTSEAGSK